MGIYVNTFHSTPTPQTRFNMHFCLPFPLKRRREPKAHESIKSELTRNANALTVPPPLYTEKEGSTLPSIIEKTYKKYDSDLRDISLKLHGYHELAYKEFKAAKLLTDYMEKEGFKVERGIAGDKTAFVATFTQGKKRPVVSFNAVWP
jgi:hypothetical protein